MESLSLALPAALPASHWRSWTAQLLELATVRLFVVVAVVVVACDIIKHSPTLFSSPVLCLRAFAVNFDGLVNIQDVVTITNELLGLGDGFDACQTLSADLVPDSTLNIADVVALIATVLGTV